MTSQKLIHIFGMFLLGLRDSLSLGWIPKILMYLDPQTKKVHPSSKKLFQSLKSALIQVLVFVLGIPMVLYFLGLEYLAITLKGLFLLLSYGYVFFYNEAILTSTREVIIWKQRRNPKTNFQLDTRQNIQFFTALSGQVKGFIFLIFYYIPILILTTIVSFIPYIGTIVMIISQAFFSGTFVFLSTWPYDKYNVAFIEKQKFYMIGFGIFISIVGNYILTGITSLAICMLITLWMLINSVIFSPVQTQFTSFSQIWSVLTNYKARNSLQNAYNLHRQKVRTNKDYRKELIYKTIFLVNPALKITQFLNEKISKLRQLDISSQKKQQEEN